MCTLKCLRNTALLTASVVNANRWPAIHMKRRFCIARVRTHKNCNIYVCIRIGSSHSRARRQISYAAIARGNTLWAWRPLFRVRVIFFATFPERFTSRPRQTTRPFQKELKNVANVSKQHCGQNRAQILVLESNGARLNAVVPLFA